MQSHPTTNTKLYCSSQLLHQHSKRSRQQHDFYMANISWCITTPCTPETCWAGSSSWHPFPLPERDRNDGDFCDNKTGLVVAWSREAATGWGGDPWANLRQRHWLEKRGGRPWWPVTFSSSSAGRCITGSVEGERPQPACRCSHRCQSPLALQAAITTGWELSSPQWKICKTWLPKGVWWFSSVFKRAKKVGNFIVSNCC